MVLQHQPTYSYSLDETDVIVCVDRWWMAFAKENGLTDIAVVGRKIWDFIADQPTRDLYREIHDHVRSSGNPISVPFRCDSPTLQHYMQLTVSKHDGGQLLYRSTVVRTLLQRRVTVLDSKQKRSQAFLTMCSFCKRSLIEPSGWLEMADISLNLRMYERQTVPQLRYTVCPACVSRMQREREQPHPASDDLKSLS